MSEVVLRDTAVLTGKELTAFHESWRGAPLSRRLQYLKRRMFIMHPLATALSAAILQRGKLRKASGEGRGIFALCPADGGKTTLLEWLDQEFPPRTVREPDPECEGSFIERTEYPYRKIDIPSPCNEGTVMKALLDALKVPPCTFKQPEDRKKHLTTQLNLARTWLIGFDNVQDIPERTGPKTNKRVGNLIRDLIDKASAVCLLLGTDDAEIVISANTLLRKRVPGRLTLGPYDVSTKAGLVQCLNMISKVEAKLPLADQEGLTEGRLGRGLACAADGKIGTVVEILHASIPHAVEAGRECLSLEDVKQGYLDLFLDYAAEIDPFDESFTPRRLTKPGEPHFTQLDEPPRRKRGKD